MWENEASEMKTEIANIREKQAQQALTESERRYRRLLAATTDYIYTVRIDDNRPGTTLHGPGCEAVTGYTSAEFASDPYLWYCVIHEEDRDAVLAQVDHILEGNTPPPLEHRIVHKQGDVRWIRNTPIPHRDIHGRLVAYDGLISDITNRKRAELLLAAEYAVTRVFTEAGNQAAAMPRVLEHLCQILRWHHAAYWRCEGGRLRRETGFWRDPLRAACLESAVAGRVLATGIGLPGRVCSDATAIWIADLSAVPELAGSVPPAAAGLRGGCAFPIRINRGIAGVIELYSREVQVTDERMLKALETLGVHIGQFIEEKRSEEKLQEERNLLRTLVDNLPDCIFVKDTESRFLLSNLAHVRMLGRTDPREVLGKTDQDFFPRELALRYREDERAILESAEPRLNYEEPVVDQAGRHYWFLCTKVPLKNRSGKTMGLVGIGCDITERRRSARKLEQAYAKLARRDSTLKTYVQQLRASHRELKETQLQLIQAAKLESLGTLAAGVAHEVKNPLQIILMGLDYLAGRFPAPDDNLGLVLSDMRGAVKRARTIIREMLSLSANSEFRWVLEDVNDVIERSLLLLRGSIIAQHITVKREFAAGLPSLPVDPPKLEQVFINLILNSLQAMPEGGTLTVRTRALQLHPTELHEPIFRKFKTAEPLVVAEIQDSGTGLTDALLSKVFDPFFTTKPVGAGTGLGLSVVRKIIDLHGGGIEIRNAPGGGALVTVVLKARKEAAYEPPQKTNSCRGRRAEHHAVAQTEPGADRRL